ncbi:MAG TPA: helix-turn-helix transcriptional regulator [Pedobacter sp.]
MKTIIDPIEQHVIQKTLKLRKEHHLTQQDIAEILNTSASFIGNVENNCSSAKYNLMHISRLAQYFGVSPKFFLPD